MARELTDNYRRNPSNSLLEPRVTRVEAELEAITRDIGILSADVKTMSSASVRQAENMEKEIQGLAVAVTSAAGPRKTDWQTIVGAIGVIMAVGAACLAPLYMRVADVETGIEHQKELFAIHEKLVMHPVGSSRVDALELALREKAVQNDTAIKSLDMKLQNETILTTKTIDQRISDLDNRLQHEFGTAQQTIRDTANALQNRGNETSAAFQKELDDLRQNGSSGTRERISTLETQIGILRNEVTKK